MFIITILETIISPAAHNNKPNKSRTVMEKNKRKYKISSLKAAGDTTHQSSTGRTGIVCAPLLCYKAAAVNAKAESSTWRRADHPDDSLTQLRQKRRCVCVSQIKKTSKHITHIHLHSHKKVHVGSLATHHFRNLPRLRTRGI